MHRSRKDSGSAHSGPGDHSDRFGLITQKTCENTSRQRCVNSNEKKQCQEVITCKPYPSSMIISETDDAAYTGSAAHKNRTRTHLTCRSDIQISAGGDYPCLCLCFGFSQITLMRPFLLMILHFSQIGFTDDLTFTLNPPFKKDRFTL